MILEALHNTVFENLLRLSSKSIGSPTFRFRRMALRRSPESN